MTKAIYSPVGTSSLEIWEGAFWKIISCACFAGINGIVRYLSSGSIESEIAPLSVYVILLIQNIIGTAILLPFALKSGFQDLRTQNTSLHLLRVITAVLGVALWYLTLKVMPIAEGIALTFTGPIFTILGAWFFLKEHIGPQRLLAILLSLAGAFMISRPDLAFREGTSAIGLAVLLPLSSAMVLAFSKLLTRKLASAGEKPVTLATYLLLLMTPFSLPLALYEWTPPTLQHWPWLILMGVLAAFSHFAFSKAYQLAEVTFLAPLGLIKLLLGALIGYVVFQEFPTTWSLWLGISIILLSIPLLSKDLR